MLDFKILTFEERAPLTLAVYEDYPIFPHFASLRKIDQQYPNQNSQTFRGNHV